MRLPDLSQLALLFDPAPAAPTESTPLRHRLASGFTFEYTVRRSARRRSITLSIDERGLRVGTPLRTSQKRIDTILNTHAEWLERKLTEWNARRPAPFAWRAGAQLHFLGKPLTLAPDTACREAARDGDCLRLPPADAATLATVTTAWLRGAALDWFGRRIAHYAPVLKVEIPLLRLSNARMRWGTCHPHGRVHLNWRLIHMPPALIDYVVVHELAHLHEPNHSPRFWRRVEAVLPDHLQRRRQMRTDAHLYLLP